MILLIYGGGGLGKEIYDLAVRSYPKRWTKIYFIDDFAEEGSCYLSESIHFDSIAEKFDIHELEGIVAVGEPVHREMLYNKFKTAGIKLATLIDKTAIISPTAKIGEGVIICEFSSIHAEVNIGDNVLIQPSSMIGHNTNVGSNSVMSAHTSPGGSSNFGKRVFIGMSAALKEKLNVGDDAIAAMGSVVFNDVEAGATVVGNPARRTKGNAEHRVFNTANRGGGIITNL